MEAIEFEKIFGDKKHLRKRLERAMEKTHDNPGNLSFDTKFYLRLST